MQVIILIWIILSRLINSLDATSREDNDELAEPSIDVKKVTSHQTWTPLIRGERNVIRQQWSIDNQEFGKKYQIDRKTSSWDNQLNDIYPESNEFEPLLPSRLLQPPLTFYSASIRDFETEDSPTPTKSTGNDNIETPTKSFNSTTVNTLKIYEITSLNSSSMHKISSGSSFFISDPSINENKSSDSLRSIIKNRKNSMLSSSSMKNNPNVIRTRNFRINRLRNSSRGNRKYQYSDGSDDISPTRSWNYWRKVRPTKRTNNLRIVGHSAGERSESVLRRNYLSHQEHTHHHSQNSAKRFACPSNPSHIYLPDYASNCQIFYICFGSDIGVPMICPNGTLFSQEHQVCDWWFNVNC